MIQKQAILDLVLAAVQSLNEELEPSLQLQLAADTLLFGEGSDLDSLSLVSVIVDIETAVADQFGEPISLTDDKAMSRPVSPYTHVGASWAGNPPEAPFLDTPAMHYSGKTVLITGSSRGVGRQLTEHMLAQGATVIGFARGEAGVTHAAYHHIQVDLADAAAITTAFMAVRKLTPQVDIVINNAAVLTSQYAMIMPPAAAQAMVNVNLLATFLVSREAAKLMRKSKWGRIINIGSMAASLEPM
eukprot:gene3067-3955_t